MLKKNPVKIDLVAFVEHVVGQVYGSDERMMLYEWLERNHGQEQSVDVELSKVIKKDGI